MKNFFAIMAFRDERLDVLFRLISKDEIEAAVGIFLGIGMVALVSKSIDDNFLLAPFGATSIIAFFKYDSEFAQPRNIILGYLITSVVGVLTVYTLGHNWFSYALGVAVAMLIKVQCNAVHPPSAAMPIILIQIKESTMIGYLIYEAMPGLVLLVAVAIIYNRYILHKDYPLWRSKISEVEKS